MTMREMQDLFVGREQELELLQEALADARDGRGRLVLLAGEPGIGKSRLADEFCRKESADAVSVAWGRCWELGGAPPYWPWSEALRAIVADGHAEGTEELGQLLNEFDDATEALAEQAHAARFRFFEGVVRFLRGAAAKQPLVIVLEDVHTADEPSLLLLEFVIRAASSLRVLVIATYRDTDVRAEGSFTGVLAELLRDRATTRAVLTGLSAHDVAEVIEATTGHAASADIAGRIRTYTEGNPLYVREVARLLTSDGKLPDSGDRLTVPRDVRETLLRRIRQLPPKAVDALTVAAVIGRDFSLDLLSAVCGSQVVADLAPAVEATLLIEPEPGAFRFSHAVVSEALYDATPPDQRLGLHRETAEAMEKLYASSLDAHLAAIAHHFLLALPLAPAEKAVDAARRAAAGDVARLAYEEGARLYRMALDAARAVDQPDLYIALLLGLGDALIRAGKTKAAQAAYVEAMDLLRERDQPQLFAHAALGYSGRFVWARAADDTRMVPLLTEALERLPVEDSIQRVRVLARLSGARRDEAQRATRDELSAEAVAMAERLGDEDVVRYALGARFCSIWGPDTVDEGRDIADRMLAIAEASSEREFLVDALWIYFLGHVVFGETDEIRSVAPRYSALGEELSQPALRWYAAVMDSIILLMEGRLDRAEELALIARELGREAQAWDADASYHLALAALRKEQGRLTEIEPAIRDAFVRFPGYRVFRCFLPFCFLETDRRAEAQALVEEMLAGGEQTIPYNNDWLASLTLLAEVASRLELRDAAASIYDRLQPYAHLVGSAGGEPVTGAIERPLGMLAATLGRLDDARAHHERALERHTRMRAELFIAHSEFDLAEVLRASGEGGASTLYARSLHRCETLGMTALADRIRRALAVPTPDERPGGLTKRELEVAALVAGGASNRDIAAELVISERTAESHVQNILTKLAFTSRAQIAAWATTENLHPGP